jgi:urea carboxylase-associated protein 1
MTALLPSGPTTSASTTETPWLDTVVAPGDGWVGAVPAGTRFRIVDLHGNQAVDMLLFDADDPTNRYSAVDTVREQGAAYLTTGSVLLTQDLDPLATIVDDTCGRHDTLGGACAQESNVVRYGPHTRHQHACRVTFVRQARQYGLDVRDLTHNINFFMNVPVTSDGRLSFEDGVSASGKHVELRAERDLVILISNCPQLNNPCNGFDPTPVRLLGWTS